MASHYLCNWMKTEFSFFLSFFFLLCPLRSIVTGLLWTVCNYLFSEWITIEVSRLDESILTQVIGNQKHWSVTSYRVEETKESFAIDIW